LRFEERTQEDNDIVVACMKWKTQIMLFSNLFVIFIFDSTKLFSKFWFWYSKW
jgi:hypothetical protein